jgi:predicted TIM-barrel fold metal-dependent hydrolase
MPFTGSVHDWMRVIAMMQKIDIHCHTTRSVLRDTVSQAATLDVIEAAMRVHNIVCTVVLATYFPEEGKGISNFRLLHWLNGNPAFRLFGSLDFQYYFKTGLRELTELAETGNLSGIKIYSGYQQIDYTAKEFRAVAALAARYQLPMMFHGGYLQCHEADKSCATSPYQMGEIAARHPQNTIIISHLAWPFVSELIEVVLAHDNIVSDMSGMLDSFKTPQTMPDCINHLKRYLEACGPQRLLFGTDFPIQTHEDSIQLVEQAMLGYSDHDKQQVYYENANRLLHKGLT